MPEWRATCFFAHKPVGTLIDGWGRGASGYLAVGEAGLHWGPGGFARWRGKKAFSLAWEEIKMVEEVKAYARLFVSMSRLFSVRVRGGTRVGFQLSDRDGEDLYAVLAESPLGRPRGRRP